LVSFREYPASLNVQVLRRVKDGIPGASALVSVDLIQAQSMLQLSGEIQERHTE